MKNLFILLLLFISSISFVFADLNDKIIKETNLVLEKLYNKIEEKDIEKQLLIYEKLLTRLDQIQNENKIKKKSELINYVYYKINNKYIEVSNNNFNDFNISFWDNNLLTGFKWTELHSKIFIFNNFYNIKDNYNYTFELINGPSDMNINDEWIITLNIPKETETQAIKIEIKIIDKKSNNYKTISGYIIYMETTVVASWWIDSKWGQIYDSWQDIVLTIPEWTVTENTYFEVLQAIDENSNYSYTTKSSNEMLKLGSLRLPDPILLKVPKWTNLEKSQEIFTKVKKELKNNVTTE